MELAEKRFILYAVMTVILVGAVVAVALLWSSYSYKIQKTQFKISTPLENCEEDGEADIDDPLFYIS